MEAFAHGAMCVSYSGRCLLSNFMTGRDSNRGACAQPCRYQYALMEAPGEYFPVFEENGETYILNSRDMCMIDHVGELMEAGLDSIKLEGRAKFAYYAAIVTGAYRHAIDAAAAGLPLDPVWRDEVEHISHRHYSTGFYYGQPGQFTQDARYIRDWQIVAKVLSCDSEGNALLSLNNKFARGDLLELVGPDVPVSFSAGGPAGRGGPASGRGPQAPDALPPETAPARTSLSLLRRQADLTPESFHRPGLPPPFPPGQRPKPAAVRAVSFPHFAHEWWKNFGKIMKILFSSPPLLNYDNDLFHSFRGAARRHFRRIPMTRDLTTGSPMRLIWSFALPTLFGMLFQQFYNMMDTVIVGQLLGPPPWPLSAPPAPSTSL